MNFIAIKSKDMIFNVIVDDEDYSDVKKYTWRYCNGYATTGDSSLRMHRLIMKAEDGDIIDHRSGNTLDNRKSNLRFCTHDENQLNKRKMLKEGLSSNYKGVSLIPNTNNWRVLLNKGKENLYNGSFSNEQAAANAYNYYAKKYHGEFARFNDVIHMSKEEWSSYEIEKVVSKSKHKNIQWDGYTEKWRVRFTYKEKTYDLGRFITEEEALTERNKKYVELGIE